MRTAGGDWRCQRAPQPARSGATAPDRCPSDARVTAPRRPVCSRSASSRPGTASSSASSATGPIPGRRCPTGRCAPKTAGAPRRTRPATNTSSNLPGCPGPHDEWLAKYGDVYSHAAVIGANLDPISGDAAGEIPFAAAIFLHRHSYAASGADTGDKRLRVARGRRPRRHAPTARRAPASAFRDRPHRLAAIDGLNPNTAPDSAVRIGVASAHVCRRAGRHPGCARVLRAPTLPLSRPARTRRRAGSHARIGHLRHRQAHVQRRDRAVRRHRPRVEHTVPHHPGPRERRCGGCDRRRRGDRVRRVATEPRRPHRAGAQPGLRRVRVLHRRLPVLLLPAPRELRQLAHLRRTAAPVRWLRASTSTCVPVRRCSGCPTGCPPRSRCSPNCSQ